MTGVGGRFDVAVVGAGPAGSATARRLAAAGCRVLLVERSRFDGLRPGESLAPAVNGLLRELGVWTEFAALDPIRSHGTRSVWGSAQPQSSSHLVSPYGCGWHVDRVRFDRMLASSAAAEGAQLWVGTAVTGVEFTGREWVLRLASPAGSACVRARVLIDATGRAGRISRRLAAHRTRFDRLVGVSATVAADVRAEGYVLVESSPAGWWYSAPSAPGQLIAMLMTDADLCHRLRAAALDTWRRLLAATTLSAERIRGCPSSTHTFPASSQRLRRADLARPWLAVGDAALAVDPISGSGVVRALGMAKVAAGAALALLSEGRSTAALLRDYEAERDAECALYLDERARYYATELRWTGEPFWQRRTRSPAA